MEADNSSSPASPTRRVPSIDAVRTIAIFAVIAIHCAPFSSGNYAIDKILLGDAIDLLARFAVPFFLITSGYFLGKKCMGINRDPKALNAFLTRIIGLIIFWYIFYLIFPYNKTETSEQNWVRTIYWSSATLFKDPANFLAGPRAHLWFLSALAIGCIHVYLVSLSGSRTLSLVYFATLYAIGLGHGAYGVFSQLAALTPNVPANLMLSPLLIALGWWSTTDSNKISLASAWFLFIAGTASTLIEAWMLSQSYNVSLRNHDFLLGTPFQAIGLIYIVRACPEWASRTALPTYGHYTLGVYAGHVAVMEILGARESGSLIWELIKAPLVYAVTLFSVVMLAKWNRLRMFLT